MSNALLILFMLEIRYSLSAKQDQISGSFSGLDFYHYSLRKIDNDEMKMDDEEQEPKDLYLLSHNFDIRSCIHSWFFFHLYRLRSCKVVILYRCNVLVGCTSSRLDFVHFGRQHRMKEYKVDLEYFYALWTS